MLRAEVGTLNAVTCIAKLQVWVSSAQGFHRQRIVLYGASDLIAEVFGERGRRARSAASAHELPSGIAVEIDLVAEVSPPM